MGELWAVCCRYNPAGYRSGVRNHEVFAASLARQGVPLLSVELAFGDAPFELAAGPHTHRLRASSVLWQKEALLNHALSLLPAGCDKVAWLDADVLWPDATWAERASDALDRHFHAVQLFEGAFRLFPGQEGWSEKNPYGGPLWWEPGAAFRLHNGHAPGDACPGFAWAARRGWMEQVGGLYDRCVIGGGDSAFLAALFGLDRPCGHRPLDEDIARWAGRLRSTRARAGYVAGTVCHLYHGNMSKRRYAQRHLVLAEHAYDPRRDVYPLGAALEWATLKPGLHRAVREYFAGRREDEPWADESGGRKLHLPG